MEDLKPFFDRYAAAFNQALGEAPDLAAIRAFFAAEFIAAGPYGVTSGKNDESFTATLREGYRFYRAIGTRRMSVRRVETTPIDATHAMAKVFYHADYMRRSGAGAGVDFQVTYVLETSTGPPRIFAFVAGDEMGVYRSLGLVNERGEPN